VLEHAHTWASRLKQPVPEHAACRAPRLPACEFPPALHDICREIRTVLVAPPQAVAYTVRNSPFAQARARTTAVPQTRQLPCSGSHGDEVKATADGRFGLHAGPADVIEVDPL
jgi:hypothetical protein